ncbi:RNA polymerase sigma factor [Patescibacteria group bacterium]|nr:RNA polymerase sigma factor [Patescibacteria group bacterium]
MEEKTDEEIAKQVQLGDAESFGILIERYELKITRYAKKFIFSGEDAKDLVQEAFIKAYTNIQSFDAGRSFSSWMYRIAHNEFINAIKKKSRMPSFLFDFDAVFPQPVSEETADSETNKKELREMLDNCLEKLDPKYREPLVLYYFENMDYKEIADILEVPVSTVGVRLQRGKANLKKIVKKFSEKNGK